MPFPIVSHSGSSPTPTSPVTHVLGVDMVLGQPLAEERFFLFYILKKLKFQKYMSVLENFKNIPRSPYEAATGLKCIFFLQICNEVPGEKKRACRPPNGRQAPVAHPSSDQQGGPAGGPVAHPAGDRGACPPRATGSAHPYIRPPPSFPPHLTSKNPQKIQKKERGEEKGRASCRERV